MSLGTRPDTGPALSLGTELYTRGLHVGFPAGPGDPCLLFLAYGRSLGCAAPSRPGLRHPALVLPSSFLAPRSQLPLLKMSGPSAAQMTIHSCSLSEVLPAFLSPGAHLLAVLLFLGGNLTFSTRAWEPALPTLHH